MQNIMKLCAVYHNNGPWLDEMCTKKIQNVYQWWFDMPATTQIYTHTHNSDVIFNMSKNCSTNIKFWQFFIRISISSGHFWSKTDDKRKNHSTNDNCSVSLIVLSIFFLFLLYTACLLRLSSLSLIHFVSIHSFIHSIDIRGNTYIYIFQICRWKRSISFQFKLLIIITVIFYCYCSLCLTCDQTPNSGQRGIQRKLQQREVI